MIYKSLGKIKKIMEEIIYAYDRNNYLRKFDEKYVSTEGNNTD